MIFVANEKNRGIISWHIFEPLDFFSIFSVILNRANTDQN